MKEFLTRKYGPLPVWTWALVISVLGFFLFRHYRNQGGGSISSSGQVVGGTTGGNPGDLTQGGVSQNPGTLENFPTVGHADLGDLGLQHNIDAVKGQIQDFADSLGSGALTAGLDGAQGNPANDATSNEPRQTADLGLKPIQKGWYWDAKSGKLVHVPGGTGTIHPPGNKGSGKKKKSKAKNAVAPPTNKPGSRQGAPHRPTKKTKPRLSKERVFPKANKPLPRGAQKQITRAVNQGNNLKTAPRLPSKRTVTKGRKFH